MSYLPSIPRQRLKLDWERCKAVTPEEYYEAGAFTKEEWKCYQLAMAYSANMRKIARMMAEALYSPLPGGADDAPV